MARQQRHFGIGAAALAGTVAAGILLPLSLAGPASAHVPAWKVDCDKIVIDLVKYSEKDTVTNNVTLTIDGEKVLDKKFGKEFHGTFPVKDHSAPIKATFVVTTTETPAEPGWNIDESETIQPCHTPTPTPTPTKTPTPTPTPTTTPTTPPTPVPSVTPTPSTTPPGTAAPSVTPPASKTPAPAPSTGGPALAETGGSSATPVIAAAGAGVLLLGGAIVLFARKRRGGSQS
ncbi:LAETG motif-containing sortase-dependent surface protein [Kitasatospora sp. NPDC057904]|uniref:LAETG motif-containing sortase-dependent surface protein n=1 Tax=Kitasatospora sp. NPDC057904 TaxID=3346275 RepID=UPI0036DD1CD1